jgi:RNA polymerase sigma-70 factor (ECF subfamily)
MPSEPTPPDAERPPQTPAEWDAFCQATLPRVYAYVAARVPIPQDAEDLTAAVFLKAVRNRDQFNGRHERSLAAWLFAIARHAIADYYRRAGPEAERWKKSPGGPGRPPDPETAVLQAERRAELLGLIRALPRAARDRRAALLRRLRNQEIAAVLGLGERTVAAHSAAPCATCTPPINGSRRNPMLPTESALPPPRLARRRPAAFEALLREAAIQPSPELAARVGREVQAALRQRSSLTAVRAVSSWRPWSGPRAAIIAALLLIGGTALAIGAWLSRLIQGDPGLASVYDRGDGIPLDLHETVDGYSIDMQWAYADGNRLVFAFTIAGPSGEPFTNLDAAYHVSTVTVSSGGAAAAVAFSTARGTAVEEGVSGSVAVYDLAGFAPGGDTLDVARRAVRRVGHGGCAHRHPHPTQYSDWWSGPYGPFVFDFSLPLSPISACLAPALDAADGGITLTLDRG